jgi:tetratricopeptide (TPR) repeat protein
MNCCTHEMEADPVRGDLLTWPISTSSADAQRAFDRGMALVYSFNHPAAEREFRAAAEHDPACAMAWWGIAHVQGPHINIPSVPPAHAGIACATLSRARALADNAPALEAAVIDAERTRFDESDFTAPRPPLEAAYAQAMRVLWERYPTHVDIGTMFAESLLNLHPWDRWTLDGQPMYDTPELMTTLERVLAIEPSHPGANHFYIHTMESSPSPEKALAAADRLRAGLPLESLRTKSAHLMHMSSHIDNRLGRWADGMRQNQAAIAADRDFLAAAGDVGTYGLYVVHCHHVLAYGAMMRGQREAALAASRAMISDFPAGLLEQVAPFIDGFMTLPMKVMMRFGMWEQMLEEAEAPEVLPVSRVFRLAMRATALAVLDRVPEAQLERAAFRRAAAALPDGTLVGRNAAPLVFSIADKVLKGELAAQEERFDVAVRSLEEAVDVESQLRYAEPPDWIQPVRHTLGAVLMRAGDYSRAEDVYREDLRRYPENVWSLVGLRRALQLLGRAEEAERYARRSTAAQEAADVAIETTCFCQPPV